jgi:hypothetical protein
MIVTMFSQLRKLDKGRCGGKGKLPAVTAKMAALSILSVIEFNPLRVNL